MKTVRVNHPKGKRPEIQLTVRRVESNVYYACGFAAHHYLSSQSLQMSIV